MIYAGFWRRLGAFFLDFTIASPLMVLHIFLASKYRLFHLYWLLPGALIWLWFGIYLVIKYGGTPGKILLGIKIVMVDGSPVTSKAASMRYGVVFGFWLIASVVVALGSLEISDAQYYNLNWNKKISTLIEFAPAWYGVVSILEQVWIWSEFISMLFNKKRRAIHDYMAGTVVIKFR
jgi:uncharacterized RDD family membrane protein YckC